MGTHMTEKVGFLDEKCENIFWMSFLIDEQSR